MERSTQRSPRLDDEMTRETEALIQSGQTESRTEEALIKEGLLPDEQPPAGAPSAHRPAGAGQLGDDEVERRSELGRWLEPHLFPALGSALVDAAGERGAPDGVLGLLSALDPEQSYQNVEAVWEAAGGHRERRT